MQEAAASGLKGVGERSTTRFLSALLAFNKQSLYMSFGSSEHWNE